MTTAPKDPAGRTGAAEEFLLTHLSDVERVVAAVSFRHRLPLGERDELASLVRLKLVENDYEVIRRFEGRCSLHTYLAVVVQRVLLDWRRSRWGKWHSSAVARRLGPVALRLEALLYRDKRSLEDAIETLLQSGSGVSADELAALARRLPPRVARREVEEEAARDLPTDGAVEDRILEAEAARMAGRVEHAITATLEALSPRDRLVLKLHFFDGCRISDVARLLNVPQKPLYRQVEQALEGLRRRLVDEGVSAETAGHLLREGRLGEHLHLAETFSRESRTASPSL